MTKILSIAEFKKRRVLKKSILMAKRLNKRREIDLEEARSLADTSSLVYEEVVGDIKSAYRFEFRSILASLERVKLAQDVLKDFQRRLEIKER